MKLKQPIKSLLPAYTRNTQQASDILKKLLEDYGLRKKGVRGHFDFAVLNPQFVQENSIASIANKKIGDTEARSRNKEKFRSELLTAIEVKYVVNNSKNFIDEIEKDIKNSL